MYLCVSRDPLFSASLRLRLHACTLPSSTFFRIRLSLSLFLTLSHSLYALVSPVLSFIFFFISIPFQSLSYLSFSVLILPSSSDRLSLMLLPPPIIDAS